MPSHESPREPLGVAEHDRVVDGDDVARPDPGGRGVGRGETPVARPRARRGPAGPPAPTGDLVGGRAAAGGVATAYGRHHAASAVGADQAPAGPAPPRRDAAHLGAHRRPRVDHHLGCIHVSAARCEVSPVPRVMVVLHEDTLGGACRAAAGRPRCSASADGSSSSGARSRVRSSTSCSEGENRVGRERPGRRATGCVRLGDAPGIRARACSLPRSLVVLRQTPAGPASRSRPHGRTARAAPRSPWRG